jgi:lipopolysaccharide biosynthesis regulator YciM
MTQYALLAVLIALLAGVLVGKGWERYKLRDGRWIDRRRLRETPHYMLGLNFLVDNHVDQAIDELTQATSTDTDALEIRMILGNLYRQKGQVGRAISIHQTLLQHPHLTTLEHAYVLLCLGLDFRHAGFVDRALEAFQDVVRLDPQNRYALVNLQKLHEDQQQWAEAGAVRERIAMIDGAPSPQNRQILGFLRHEMGRALSASGDTTAAVAHFREAIDIDAHTTPAYLSLGDAQIQRGDLSGAIDTWEQFTQALPDRAYLAFDRLQRAYRAQHTPSRFVDLCQGLIANQPYEWRARQALAKHLSGVGRHREAFDILLDALTHHPHGLAIHQEVWRTLSLLGLDKALVDRYVDLTRDAVFYLDPHVCVRCRYRSTELLWLCPQCHEWNTFVEERMTPALAYAVETLASES